MLDQERSYRLRFVRGQIVEDDVNLSGARRRRDDIGQELDERITRVPRHGLATTSPVCVFNAANNESVPCR